MTDATVVPMTQVKFGHEYPGLSVNVRKTDRSENIEELVASLRAEGLLQPMAAIRRNGTIYVVDGNRRLAAMQSMDMKALPIDAFHFIKAESPEAALAAGLAANIERVPLHEVDRFEAFAALRDAKMATPAIASRFGVDEKVVRRALALGDLAPEIRKRWREGKIDAQLARTFALQPDQKKQAEVLHRLEKAKNLHVYAVKSALIGDTGRLADLLKYVTRQAYTAHGGAMIEDLFGDAGGKAFVADVALLERLAREKAAPKIDQLKADGWGWIEFDTALPENWRWNWTRRTDVKGTARKQFGVVLEIDAQGLRVTFGVLKPGQKVAAEKQAAKKKAKPTALTSALKHRLESQLLKATQDAVRETFPEPNTTAGALAQIVCALINPERPYAMPSALADRLGAVRDSLPADVLKEALHDRFDAKDYFRNAPLAVILAAIEKVCGAEHARKLKGKTRAAVTAFALENLAPKGWVPKELDDRPADKRAKPKRKK